MNGDLAQYIAQILRLIGDQMIVPMQLLETHGQPRLVHFLSTPEETGPPVRVIGFDLSLE